MRTRSNLDCEGRDFLEERRRIEWSLSYRLVGVSLYYTTDSRFAPDAQFRRITALIESHFTFTCFINDPEFYNSPRSLFDAKSPSPPGPSRARGGPGGGV